MTLVKCKECGHKVSKKAKKCPSCGHPRKVGSGPSCAGLGCLALFVLLAAIAINNEINELSEPGIKGGRGREGGVQSDDRGPGSVIPCEVLETKDISYRGKRRATCRVVVETELLPSEEDLRATAFETWRLGGQAWDEFTVFQYLPEMETDGAAYGVAEFSKKGLADFALNDVALLVSERWRPQSKAQIQEDENQEAWEAAKTAPEVKDFYLSAEGTREGDRARIIVSTDLPNGTVLSLDVYRLYWEANSDEPYAGEILNELASVEEGRIERVFQVDDSAWLRERLEKKPVLQSVGEWSEITKYADELTIRALFTSHQEQPPGVRAVLGEQGEFVGGDQAHRAGTGTALDVEASVPYPFEE